MPYTYLGEYQYLEPTGNEAVDKALETLRKATGWDYRVSKHYMRRSWFRKPVEVFTIYTPTSHPGEFGVNDFGSMAFHAFADVTVAYLQGLYWGALDEGERYTSRIKTDGIVREKEIPYWPYCTTCHEPFNFEPDAPFADCKCGTTEWGNPRPAPYVDNPMTRELRVMFADQRPEYPPQPYGMLEDIKERGDLGKLYDWARTIQDWCIFGKPSEESTVTRGTLTSSRPMKEGDWIGVDLDGTLAEYDKKYVTGKIGAPIASMVERVKKWLAAGIEVRIFTARISVIQSGSFAQISDRYKEAADNKEAIEAWCIEHIGQRLMVTNIKDHKMHELWDDRAVRVIFNTGIRADGVGDDHG